MKKFAQMLRDIFNPNRDSPPKPYEKIPPEKQVDRHEKISKIIRDILITIIGYSFFCGIVLLGPDSNLLTKSITIPFAAVPISSASFLMIGPLVLVVLSAYLHIFVAEWEILETLEIPEKEKHPYMFNLNIIFANFLKIFLFYLLCPAVLMLFIYKQLPLPGYRLIFCIVLTLIVITAYFLLGIRRLSHEKLSLRVGLFLVWIIIAIFTVHEIGAVNEPWVSRNLNLAGADLRKADFKGISLSGANLYTANLSNADLREVDMSEARLAEADLSGTKLHGVSLNNTDLRNANLFEADLSGAKLSRADLSEAYMHGANLNYAHISYAMLRGAKLKGAKLKGADLIKSDLSMADLSMADLSDANLSETDLRRADLSGADLSDTNLSGADLSWADLQGAKGITRHQIIKAKNWMQAIYDDDFRNKYVSPVIEDENKE